ncbi:MAG: hypothetical protein ACYDDZ_09445 [Acidimicrobiales bacterium]
MAAADGLPLSTLRGAGVDVDIRYLSRVVTVVLSTALLALAAALFIAGERRNAQINALRTGGIPVVMTVTGCIGLMGGSGSNPVGYRCRGTYLVDQQRYSAAVPGSALHSAGADVAALAARGDPALVSSAHLVAGEHQSWKVYAVPSLLVALVVAVPVAWSVRRRRRRRTGPGRDETAVQVGTKTTGFGVGTAPWSPEVVGYPR